MRSAPRSYNPYRYDHYWQLHEGLGVYRAQRKDPEELEDVWPALQEPALQRTHQERIQPVDDANKSALRWALIGLVGMGAGIGTAAAIQGETGTGAAIAGLSGLAIGVVGVIGATIALPSPHDEMAADARRQLFFAEEDDLQAVARGVDRSNARRRTLCGGAPAEPSQVVAAVPPVRVAPPRATESTPEPERTK
jgi:hypothetical protein